jgi:hypothetical protein
MNNDLQDLAAELAICDIIIFDELAMPLLADHTEIQ